MSRAKLRIHPVNKGLEKVALARRPDQYFIRFDASNGEPLGTGETHPTIATAEASRDAWLRAMVQVLQDEGVQLFFPSNIAFPWMKGMKLPKRVDSDYYVKGYEDGFEGRPQGADNPNVSDLADEVGDYYRGYDAGKADREAMQRRGSSNT